MCSIIPIFLGKIRQNLLLEAGGFMPPLMVKLRRPDTRDSGRFQLIEQTGGEDAL